MFRVKKNDRVEIIATGETGKVLERNGDVLHIMTKKGEIVKTKTDLVKVLGILSEILASIIKIIAYFKK